MNNTDVIVYDPQVFVPVIGKQSVRCECGKLCGDAVVVGVPKGKRGGTEYKLAYSVSGTFYQRKDGLLVCLDCHKPALSSTEPGGASQKERA